MIYAKSEAGQTLIVLGPGNLEALQQGTPNASPDQSVVIMYSPDVVWVGEELSKMKEGFTAHSIVDIVRQSLSRAPDDREYFPAVQLVKDGRKLDS